MPNLCPAELTATLAAHAGPADDDPLWPTASWEALREAGVLGWCIPRTYGGQEHEGHELLQGYEDIACGCLTTALILSQREAACRRIRDSANEALRHELLLPLARGASFATVGLSQLTTSRQHGQPALVVRQDAAGFHLDGLIPWVTGAEQAAHLVIGGVLDDGRQVLLAMPRTLPGVSIGPPLNLMALQGSLTAEVRCNGVVVDSRWLLAGPAERVLAAGRGGAGGLETSSLGLGLAGAAISYLHEEGTTRQDLRASADRLEQVRLRLREEMHRLAETATAEAASALRARVNSLVLRATQTALMAAKGSGFLRQHPAQRWARQALFFLVWSCPRPAAEATLSLLTGDAGGECS